MLKQIAAQDFSRVTAKSAAFIIMSTQLHDENAVCLGEGNVPQMKRLPNDASPDRNLDLLRRLRCRLRRARVAIAQAQAYPPTLRTLWALFIPAGHAEGILRIYNRKGVDVPWSQRVCRLSGWWNASAMTEVTMSG
ncbi:hypothetical protein [Bradyrhizobium sp. LTSP849]|uniref:hypothetical protein n=1 Tax=Bradyrhizobium sp. LTSP849 TaxID=1615890 RepID=UPI0012E02B4A|nr:hypothetical protein [Bradyrhizobium sp. LTSP849]